MTYQRKEIYIRDKHIQIYLDRLMKDDFTQIPPKIAQEFSRHKTIRRIREMDRINPYILIGADQKYHVSMIKIRKPLKINKKGDRYIFSL